MHETIQDTLVRFLNFDNWIWREFEKEVSSVETE
jgi:hypothetical protein